MLSEKQVGLTGEALIALLKSEVLPTMGCTESGAVALAAAKASEVLAREARYITVTVNANVFKNGVAVGIPRTGTTGLEIAAALGAIKKHSHKQLAVLSDVSAEELEAAKALVAEGKVSVIVDEKQSKLWIKVQLFSPDNWSQVIIKDKHTNIVSVQKDGIYLFTREAEEEHLIDYRQILGSDFVTIAKIVAVAEALPESRLAFLLEGINMNLYAALAGTDKKLGMGIGAELKAMTDSGVLADDVINYAKQLTAAAADARMSGESISIMSSAGSGNHGITVILPVYAVAKKIGAKDERLLRALAISHLITMYIKMYTGNVSALCDCAVTAATGASAAITWLMGGNMAAIEAAMKNVIANLAGMICDSGKVGCALKLSTAAAAAVESSLLAQRHITVPDANGIIDTTIESTIQNLGQISNPGMLDTDAVIMKVMLEKKGGPEMLLKKLG